MISIVVAHRVFVRGDIPRAVLDGIREEFTHANPDKSRLPALEREVEKMRKSARGRKNLGRALAQVNALREAPDEIVTFREERVEFRSNDGSRSLGPAAFSIPRGGMRRLVVALRAAGLRFEVADARALGPPAWEFPAHGVALWPLQVPVVDACIEKQNCLVRSGAGSGKTTALLAAIARAGLPALVIVPTKQTARQWIRRAAKELGVDAKTIGMLGDGRHDVGAHLTIALPITLRNMLRKDPELKRRWGFVAFDEVQGAAAETCYEVVDALSAKFRVGVSDDERRKDRKDFLIRDLFGEVACQVDDAALEEDGAVVPVEYVVIPTGFAPEWYLRTPRAQWGLLFDQLLDEMTKDERRNEIVAAIARRIAEAGEQALYFSHRVEHAKALARANMSGLMIGGEENSDAFEAAIAGLADGSMRAAAGTYQALGKAIDLPTVSAGVAVTPIYGNIPFRRQVEGRIRRRSKGKTRAILFFLWDEKIQGAKALRELVDTGRKVEVVDGDRVVEGSEYLKEFEDAAKAERRREQEERAAEG